MTTAYKNCSKCKTNKPVSEFFTDRRLKTGKVAECKACYSERKARTRVPEIERAKHKKWKASEKGQQYQSRQKQKALEKRKQQLEVRLDRLKVVSEESTVAWRKAHAKRAHAKTQATPKWIDETHKQKINDIYALTQQLQELTASIYHVDHIVPLVNDTVCGLHVWWNMQPLIESANVVKSNNVIPELYPEQGRVAFPSGDGPIVTGIVTQTSRTETADE
jgi:hypothetical protein